jgi:hypothetical protein
MRKLAITGLVALAGLAAAAAPASAQEDPPPGPCEITFNFISNDLGTTFTISDPWLAYAYTWTVNTACGPTG